MKGYTARKNRFLAAFLAALMVVSCVVMGHPFLVNAAGAFPDNGLIVVGGKTVEQNDTINDVTALFGQPKLVTDSPFGGSAYTFYGDNYSDYLYLETNADGSIAAYGSISQGFQTKNVNFGDTYTSNQVTSYRVATDSDDAVYGFVGYTRNASLSATAYHQALVADLNRYDTSLCQQSVLMFNAVSALYGDNTPMAYDQATYERTLQMAENGSNVYNYARATGKTGAVTLFASGSYNFSDWTYINPLYFAESAANRSVPAEGNQAQFVFYSSNGRYYQFTGCINSNLYDSVSVPLTEQEQQTIAEMKEMYQHYGDLLDSIGATSYQDYYEQEPSFETLPITPGAFKPAVLEGAVEYLNLIRYGAGLDPLTLSQQLCEGAQAKAAYTIYLAANNIRNPDPHHPPKVEGISDEFYDLCGLGRGENLYGGNVVDSIRNALNDGDGDPITCGHRHLLLSPAFTKVGFGEVEGQSAHKFDGQQDVDVEAVCWPSAGVTPMQAIRVNNFRWSAQLYDYTTTSSTTVTVTQLNTGDQWQFGSSDLYRESNFLSWKDSDLSVSAGDVYQVTISNLKDESGNSAEYSYRAVIANVYEGESNEITSLTLNQTSYSGQTGDVVKLNATITPNGVQNALVTWTSSNPAVAAVTQNGVVTLKAGGTATITATASNGMMAQAVIQVSGAGLSYDVDGDGTIGVLDVMQLAQMIVALKEGGYLPSYDFNQDGRSAVTDVMALAQYVVQQASN